jgi:hypothetical protein
MAQHWQRITNWLDAQSQMARIALGVSALVIGCGCCSLGYAAGSSGSSNNTPAVAAATATATATQVGPTATAKPPTATPKPKTWVTIKHLAGSGNSQSDTFEVRTGDHILTSCTTSSEANLFIADLYRQGESYGNNTAYAELVDRANQPCSKDTYTIQQDGANVYLRVQADSIQWTVDVQRFQ